MRSEPQLPTGPDQHRGVEAALVVDALLDLRADCRTDRQREQVDRCLASLGGRDVLPAREVQGLLQRLGGRADATASGDGSRRTVRRSMFDRRSFLA